MMARPKTPKPQFTLSPDSIHALEDIMQQAITMMIAGLRNASVSEQPAEREVKAAEPVKVKRSGPRRQMSIYDVLAVVPVSRSTLLRMIERNEFPSGHFISPNRRVWYEDEILLWQDSLPAHSKRKRRHE